MAQKDKDTTRERYLRMAAKWERRKENEARKKARSDDRGGRGAPDVDADEWDEDEQRRFAKRRRSKSRSRSNSKRGKTGAETKLGQVVGLARGTVRVRIEDDEWDVPLGGGSVAETLTVGDELDCEPRRDGPPRLVELRPRRSVLSRPDPGNKRKELLVAANVDVGVIVAAAKSPPLRPGLVDRYMLALEEGGVEPLLCVNKIDLCSAEEREELERTLAPHRALGLQLVTVSASTAEGIEALRAKLAGRTCVLVGHSGVGKSSVLNALAGDQLASAGSVRDFDGRGRHTTTASAMHAIPGGVRIIDTAGIRVFGLWGLRAEDLRTSFPGLEVLAADCRFADCLHREEPACAVRRAVDDGRYAEARFAAYLRLLDEVELQ